MNALCHGLDFFGKRAIGAHDHDPVQGERVCSLIHGGYVSCAAIEIMCGTCQKMCIMMLDRQKTDDIDRPVCQD
jgi:hypothetical protein